ncbi:MAG: polymer-forming cytoskeletal protein [Candidatus Hydrogenedentes bacterium]|nr:polymer-forming cytoskeletal protein [Candidatus Hydrogenedentota bacterium]
MLDARKGKNYNENKVVSIIGPGTTVSGEVNSKGTIRIEGTVTGRINSDDSIVVHESGRVKADLIAGQVIISGEVLGNVFAHDRLEITTSGKVVGDITAPRISIAEGVLFEGKCTMKPPGQAKAPTDMTPAGAGVAPGQPRTT